MRKIKSVAILMIAASFGGLALGQAGWMPKSYTLEIAPPHPDSSQLMTLTLSGLWNNSCVPTGSELCVKGGDLFWDVFLAPSDLNCLQVISPWHQTRTLGPLVPGLYRVNIRPIADGVPGDYVEIGSFRVTPAPTTTVYRFLDDQSILTISGGIGGMMLTSPVWGSFQCTMDKPVDTARFDWVDASYFGPDKITSGDLGRLFNMTELTGARASANEFYFTGQTTPPLIFDVELYMTFQGDLVHLRGGFPPRGTCCDLFFYELDARAKAVRSPCKYRLAGDLNDDCKVSLADLAILAANWLYDCNLDPDNPACVVK